MNSIQRIRLLTKRISVISSAFQHTKSLKAAYLLSKHPYTYNRRSLNDVKWTGENFYFRQNNFKLNLHNTGKLSADFGLIKKMMTIGEFDYVNNELVFKVSFTTPQIQIKIKNWDILSLTYDLFIKGEYDISKYIGKLLTVIDVGMNVSVAGLYFASYENVSSVYGFEPLPANFNLAIENLELNPLLRQKIRPYNYGLAEEERIIELEYRNEGDLGFSTADFIIQRKSVKKNGESRKTAISLKNAAEEISRILNENKTSAFFLKLDCEGSEYEIIQSLAKQNLLREIFLVHIEWHYKGPEGLKKILKENNFEIIEEVKHDNNYTGLLKAVNNEK